MKKFFRRLLPLTSLLCLPLLGSYHPVASWEGLSPDEAQLAALNRNAVYQSGSVTRDYLFTLIGNAPIDGIRDWFGNDDFRFFTMLTNFRRSGINSQIVARTATGQNFINTIGPGNGTYAQSQNYPGYGRFHFNAGKPRVYNFYGRDANNGPRPNAEYLVFVQRDMLVRATGVPTPGLAAAPAGW